MRSLLRGRPQSTYLALRSEGPASPGRPGTLSPAAPHQRLSTAPPTPPCLPIRAPCTAQRARPAPPPTPALYQALSPARPEPPDPPRSPRSRRRGSAGPGPAASRLAAASFLRAARRGFGFQPTSSARRTRTPDPETRQRPARPPAGSSHRPPPGGSLSPLALLDPAPPSPRPPGIPTHLLPFIRRVCTSARPRGSPEPAGPARPSLEEWGAVVGRTRRTTARGARDGVRARALLSPETLRLLLTTALGFLVWLPNSCLSLDTAGLSGKESGSK